MKKIITILFFITFFTQIFAGQLGDGTNKYQRTPVYIMDEVKEVSSSSWNTLILKNDNTLWACGKNSKGEINPNKKNIDIPVKLADNIISFCSYFTSIVYTDAKGDLYLVGDVSSYIKNPKTTFSSKPIKIASNVKQCLIAYNQLYYVDNDSNLFSYSESYNYFLNCFQGIREEPVVIMQNVKEISYDYNLNILKNDGELYTLYNDVPKLISSDVKKIKGTCFLKNNGDLYCGGTNVYGALGLGEKKIDFDYIKLSDDCIDMDGNEDVTFFVKSNGDLYVCGGGNKYELGRATGDGKPHLTPYKLMTEVKNIHVGLYCGFIIKKDSSLWAFGANSANDIGGI